LSGDEDVLRSAAAGAHVIRGTLWRVGANLGGIAVGIGTAALLLRHLGVAGSGRYVTVLSLVAVPVAVAETGLNAAAGSELALRSGAERAALLQNVLGQRLLVAPVGVAAPVLFALAAGYPQSMVIGSALAGAGVMIAAIASALLLGRLVELRNVPFALFELSRQVVTLAGVALLVARGAALTPFFAVQILSGGLALALVPLLAGRAALIAPRFERSAQRQLLAKGLPVAAALVLGQLYFRFVILLMSLIASARQTGYFGGSLRAMEPLVMAPVLVAQVAIPLLSAAAREDRERLRYALRGLGEGAVIAGALVILVASRAAAPVIALIGGARFRPAGAVLSIQVVALLFIALYQLWTGALIALGRQRELIATNAVALAGVGCFAAILVPALGARGGALASVLGDALLASMIYWRVRRATGPVMVGAPFLARVLGAAAPASAILAFSPLGGIASALLAALVFVAAGLGIGMFPPELRAAISAGALRSRSTPAGDRTASDTLTARP